ncbi:hypothetical protein ACMYSQ_012354 [Aspergillus niger]
MPEFLKSQPVMGWTWLQQEWVLTTTICFMKVKIQKTLPEKAFQPPATRSVWRDFWILNMEIKECRINTMLNWTGETRILYK